jgi:hypothetical protein
MALVFALGMVFIPTVARRARAATYVDTALTTHRSYLDDKLPLEIESDSPEAVTGWFAGKVPFDFRLPTSQTSSNGEPAYRRVGARLTCPAGAVVTANSFIADGMFTGQSKEFLQVFKNLAEEADAASRFEVICRRFINSQAYIQNENKLTAS